MVHTYQMDIDDILGAHTSCCKAILLNLMNLLKMERNLIGTGIEILGCLGVVWRADPLLQELSTRSLDNAPDTNDRMKGKEMRLISY